MKRRYLYTFTSLIEVEEESIEILEELPVMKFNQLN